jgi:hypothetical protein
MTVVESFPQAIFCSAQILCLYFSTRRAQILTAGCTSHLPPLRTSRSTRLGVGVHVERWPTRWTFIDEGVIKLLSRTTAAPGRIAV